MKVFLSSVISGFEAYRDAAVRAIRALGHQVIRAEDFSASSHSPQQVCLQGVRDADAVVLVIGERYGYVQASGLSATHEEFREARETKDILVFVQDGIQRDEAQRQFLHEVQSWASGKYTAKFTTPDDLRDAITGALHHLALSYAAGRADESEMLTRATQLIPSREYSGASTLFVAVAGGPRQQVLRPAEIASKKLETNLKQKALFGDFALFSTEEATKSQIQGGMLALTQERAALYLGEDGAMLVAQAAQHMRNRLSSELPNVLLEEEIAERIERSLRFIGTILDDIDPVQRLSDVVPVAAILGAAYGTWPVRCDQISVGVSDRLLNGSLPAQTVIE